MNPEPKEEIRSRLNIEDVVADYVELRRAGRNFKALSPFTKERTPSFIVSPEKQIWYDFSSNRGGDIFKFVIEMEGVDFKGALDILARKAGVDLSVYHNDKSQALHKKKQRLFDAVELAAKFYEFTLSKSKLSQDYWFNERGFSQSIVKEFRLGYAPKDGKSLFKFLMSRGFTSQELQEAGLVSRRYTSDMFRERVMVPLCDGQGRVVGFTARLLTNQKNSPKYINTPQTMLYDKGRQLFGLHLAKDAIRESDYVVIVEGNLDVIASHQAGERAVVASAGTAITKDHFTQISRLTPNVKLAFDGDAAGLAATERAIKIAQETDIELSVISLPKNAKDPDELIQQDVNKWREAIASSMNAVEWVIKIYEEKCDLKTSGGKKSFTSKTLETVKQLKDPVEQEHYVQIISQKSGSTVEVLFKKMNGIKDQAPKRALKKSSPKKFESNKNFEQQDDFLALNAACIPARKSLDDLPERLFDGEERRFLASFLRSNQDTDLNKTLPNSLQQYETYVKILLLRASERHGQYSGEESLEIAKEMAQRIKKEKQMYTRQFLTTKLAEAEQKKDISLIQELRQKLIVLIKEQEK